jgi:uncharacterized protein (TIGR03083 family)
MEGPEMTHTSHGAPQVSHALDHDSYCSRVAVEIERFAASLSQVDADTPVPSCPAWRAKDLAAHMGMIHRWVNQTVRDQSRNPLEFTQFGHDLPQEWVGFSDWLGSMATPLSQTLRQADLDGPAWSFTDNQQARFWPRRMLHETVVHRADAELAAGQQPRIDTDTAVDGIDELLYLLSFGHPFRATPKPPDLRGGGETIHLHGTDVDVHWLIRLGPNGHTWEHLSHTPSMPASTTVCGNAADLHLFQYNRLLSHDAQVHITGDRTVLSDWLTRSAL